MENIGKLIGGVAIAGLIGFAAFGGDASSSTNGRYGEYEDSRYEEYENVEELAYDHWDEVQGYMSGTETIEACSDSGCYSLDADIYDGRIDTLYFPNGGYIYPDAEIDESGFAEGYEGDGNYWEFEVDLDSSTVQDAISDWASDYQSDYEEYQYEDNYRY